MLNLAAWIVWILAICGGSLEKVAGSGKIAGRYIIHVHVCARHQKNKGGGGGKETPLVDSDIP